jgi:hypothetical protein
MFLKELKRFDSDGTGLQRFVIFTVIYILFTIIFISIQIFKINMLDPHDPKVLIFEFLPVIILIVISMIIGIKIYDKIKNKKYIIPVFFLSQAVLFMSLQISSEKTSLKEYIFWMSILVLLSLIQYLFFKICQKAGLYSIKCPKKDNNEEKK